MPQRFSLYADLKGLENICFFGCAYRVSRDRLRARIDRLLSELDLSANQNTRAGRLSGGFKQLHSISCAVIHEPSLLFLDEPTAGLDPVHRQHIWAILYDLNRQRTLSSYALIIWKKRNGAPISASSEFNLVGRRLP